MTEVSLQHVVEGLLAKWIYHCRPQLSADLSTRSMVDQTWANHHCLQGPTGEGECAVLAGRPIPGRVGEELLGGGHSCPSSSPFSVCSKLNDRGKAGKCVCVCVCARARCVHRTHNLYQWSSAFQEVGRSVYQHVSGILRTTAPGASSLTSETPPSALQSE